MRSLVVLAAVLLPHVALAQSDRTLVPGQRAGDIVEGMTDADLARVYGAANVSQEERYGAEGETYTQTVVFAGDPEDELRINWGDPELGGGTVVYPVGTAWRLSVGALAVGMTLAEVEQANRGAFTLLGFGWDYGGYVSSWLGGALGEGVVFVRFDCEGAPCEAVVGDQEFPSQGRGMRLANPRVTEVGVALSRPAAD